MALNRLHNIERKMTRDPEYAARYIANIDDYVSKGYARKLSEKEIESTNSRTWYLPHFVVVNPNKPQAKVGIRCRIHHKRSIAQFCLDNWTDQLQSLSCILHKFRMGIIGVCGDIRKMYHQILILPEDRNSQRFLWRSGDVSKPVDTYVMDVLTFGASCSPCSAQHVKNLNADEHAIDRPAAVRAIKELHYVDDYVASFETLSDAIEITKDVINIHSLGGFELRNFASNRREVLDALESNHLQPAIRIPNETATTNDKILGMMWNTSNGKLTFVFRCHKIHADVLSSKRPPTKREVLSVVMSVFDPFGLLADFMLFSKLLIQDIWKTGLGWDEPVDNNITVRWQMWFKELNNISRCRVPRCYSPRLYTSNERQLHIFADASESAFACVAYWRVKGLSADYAFISGKTKCAPQTILSIPRLELQAAVLAARL